MIINTYIAHIREKDGKEQLLSDHLKGTQKLCRQFADSFDNGDFAAYCGLIHDIGKYSDESQKRIRGMGGKCDHSTAGAKIAIESTPFGKLAAHCIAGHHSGLMDSGSKADCKGVGTLYSRLSRDNKIPFYENYKSEIDTSGIAFRPVKISSAHKKLGFSFSFFTRMIYSCLTDADFIDTERFMNPDSLRKSPNVDFNKLLEKFNRKLSEFKGKIGDVNAKRNEILNSCIKAANSPRGLFTFTVPAGAGKTLSSMAFALNHLIKNGMRRIIYVIPYTSIIEQNAKVFSDILGRKNILEHHSNYDFDNPENKIGYSKSLAAENWDMPIIVTTNVQFFESLFANKSSKCRKLHNIANSIIIFDEAQMLPVEYLKPCVNAIAELVKNYKCSAVLCSATQPALKKIFPPDIKITEICKDVKNMYKVFKRAEILNRGTLLTEELANEVSSLNQCLIIVNTRKHARKLFSILKGKNVFHLSTLMCPANRKKTIEKIRKLLQTKQRCIVVSTPLIEAGVDIDFPVVFRALCGLDSLIQSMGRCNREGELKDENGHKQLGKVYLFKPEDHYYKNQPSSLGLPIKVTEEIIRNFDDITSPEAIKNYFERLYAYSGGQGLDIKNIMNELEKGVPANPTDNDALFNYNFKSIAKKFKLIDDNTYSVIVPFDENAKNLIAQLDYTGGLKSVMRSLQQYTVNIYSKEFEALAGAGKVKMLTEDTAVLISMSDYSENTGINIDIKTGIGVFL